MAQGVPVEQGFAPASPLGILPWRRFGDAWCGRAMAERSWLMENGAMTSLAVVGAGPIGSALTHAVAQRQAVSRIWLIDEVGGVAAGVASDVFHSVAVGGLDVHVLGETTLAAAARADAIVLADQAASGKEWQGEPGLVMVDRLNRFSPQAPILLAGAQHAWIIERAAAELRIAARRLVGSAPLALEAALRTTVAREAGVSSLDVHLPLVGRPPVCLVIDWDHALVAGQPARWRLGDRGIARIDRCLSTMWPPGPAALAAAGAGIVEAVVKGSRRAVPCFVVCDGTLWDKDRVLAVPARLGRAGFEEVRWPDLMARDRTTLESSLSRRGAL